MKTTEKYIRESQQWVKITRDQEVKQFVFARGYENEVVAHDMKTWSFKHVSTWNAATAIAKQMIKDYA